MNKSAMAPEDTKRIHDWIDVREELLSRVASLDPKVDSKGRNLRPMYAHLLLALRRATVTLIRIISTGQAEYGKRVEADDDRGFFEWRGQNYLAKIWCVLFPGVLAVSKRTVTSRLYIAYGH